MSCCERLRDVVPARHLLCLLFFLGFMVTFLLRVNINIAIVGMVNTTGLQQDAAGQGNGSCLHTNRTLNSSQQDSRSVQGEFDWDEMEQSIILSSFFWGYLFFQVPGGRIAELVGAKKVYGASIFINGVLCLLLPLLARAHWTSLLVIRALQGLTQGVLFPSLSASVTQWVPLEERARFVSFAVQGASLGTVVAMPLCGTLLDTWGWQWVFYVSGLLALLWCCAWWLLMFDSPEQHPRITAAEKLYLQQNLATPDKNKPPVPWREVLTSWQFLLGCIACIGNDWGYHTLITLGPKYLKGALGFNVAESSWLTSLPYFCQYVFANLFGAFVDMLLKQEKLSLLGVRRLSTVISHIVPAVTLVALSMTGCNTVSAVVILTLSITFIGAYSSGFYQNAIDIAPNYAGSLTGLTNAAGSMTGIISTPVAGAVLQNDSTTEGWKVIFWISAAMYMLCSIPYLMFATAEVQPWNSATGKSAVVMSNLASDTEDDATDDELNKTKHV